LPIIANQYIKKAGTNMYIIDPRLQGKKWHTLDEYFI
jgi:hypothetical protein